VEKHWTAYLPGAGRIKRKGEDILYLHRLLGQAKAEVRQLRTIRLRFHQTVDKTWRDLTSF